jgi:hypothetical protein
MHPITVLVLGAVGDHPLERIAAVDPGVRVVDARGVFEVEYVGTWPTETVERYVPQSLTSSLARRRKNYGGFLTSSSRRTPRSARMFPTQKAWRCFARICAATSRANRCSM